MHALAKHTLALTLCAACSVGTEDHASVRPLPRDDSALSLAGAPADAAAPLPLSEEELERRLDALEQELEGPQ